MSGERITELKRIFIFQLLNEDEMAQVADILRPVKYPAGAKIFSQKDEGDRMYVITQGLVRITIKDNEEDAELATLMPGDFFGEIALFEKVPRTATVTALDESSLLMIHRDDFARLISKSPYTVIKILFRIIQSMGQRLRVSNVTNRPQS